MLGGHRDRIDRPGRIFTTAVVVEEAPLSQVPIKVQTDLAEPVDAGLPEPAARKLLNAAVVTFNQPSDGGRPRSVELLKALVPQLRRDSVVWREALRYIDIAKERPKI